MKVQYISMVIHKEEQAGFLFEGVNKRTSGFAFDSKKEALEHQDQFISYSGGEKACGVMVCVSFEN